MQNRSSGRSLEPSGLGRQEGGWQLGSLARFLAGALAVAAILASAQAVSSEPLSHPREKTFLKRQWGVEVMDVRQTAAGYMLEFRYRVLDQEKARPLFERRTKPVLTHAESGARLLVPTPAKTGALRNSNPPIAGHIYWMFFANSGKVVKPGDHVSVAIGEFRTDQLVVR